MRIYWFCIWRNLNPCHPRMLVLRLILLHPRMLFAKFGWNWPSGSGEEDFLISSMYFRYFVILSPWKRAGPFIWTNLNLLHPRMLCDKFGWNWPSDSGEEGENVISLQTEKQTDKQTDRQTTDDRVIRKAHLSFQLRWAKKPDQNLSCFDYLSKQSIASFVFINYIIIMYIYQF